MTRTIVGLFDTRNAAEQVVSALNDRGFVYDDIGLVTQDGAASADPAAGAGIGAASGGALGGVLGLLVGIGALAIPGIGPIVAAGPLAAALGVTGASTLIGAGVGAASGGMLGALTGLGLNDNDASAYAEGVRRGGTLVTANVDDGRIDEALAIFNGHGAANIETRRGEWERDGWQGYDADAPFYERAQGTPVVVMPLGTTVGPGVIPPSGLTTDPGIPPVGEGSGVVVERSVENPDDLARLAR